MKTLTKTLSIIVGCTVLSASPIIFAKESSEQLNIQAGAAVLANTGRYAGSTEDYALVPLLMLDYKNFYFQTSTAGYRFFQKENGTSLSFEVSRTSDGYEASDADGLTGMAERKGAWEVGLKFEVMTLGGQLTANLMQDVGETHQGLSAKVNYERPMFMGATHMVTWYAGGDFWDQERTNYYYGVSDSEATSARAAYKPTNSTNLYVGTNVMKQLSPKFTLLANAQYMMLGEAAEQSPLVSRDDQWSTFAGVLYQF